MFRFDFKSDFSSLKFMIDQMRNEMIELLVFVAEKIRQEWIEEIDRADAPEKFKQAYIESTNIDIDINSDYTARVSVTGGGNLFSNLVEFGAKRFDMKIGLLKSKRAKISKEGYKYIIIPFRHGTPTSQGKLNQSPMPKGLYEIAKKLKQRQSLKQAKFQEKGKMEDIKTFGKKATHKSGKYEGLTRYIQRTTGGKKQSTYFTFRGISERTQDENPSAWWHPGFTASPVYKKIAEKISLPEFSNMVLQNLKARIGL